MDQTWSPIENLVDVALAVGGVVVATGGVVVAVGGVVVATGGIGAFGCRVVNDNRGDVATF